ncbi:hypothetical protein [Microcoleus sp.]|uniref:hypothetical protein n=1 Tax=Microcoleus sp. TaxID=44472 RepID=UPI003592F2CD
MASWNCIHSMRYCPASAPVRKLVQKSKQQGHLRMLLHDSAVSHSIMGMLLTHTSMDMLVLAGAETQSNCPLLHHRTSTLLYSLFNAGQPYELHTSSCVPCGILQLDGRGYLWY